MPNDGTGASWDKTTPGDSSNVSDIPVEIRDVRAGVELRLEKEHVALANSSAGGEHLAGSAKAYYGTSFPTKRPDTTTNLDNSDRGRLDLKSDDGSLWWWDGSAWQRVKIVHTDAIDAIIEKTNIASGFTQGILPLAVVVDAKSDGTDAGTFTSGAWRTRVLNSIVCDNGSIVSVASNQITLGTGTYRVRASAPGQQCGSHQIRWNDITNTNVIAYGTSESSPAGTGYQTRSELCVEFTVSGDTAFELQHRCTVSKSGSGLGLAAGLGVGEVYAKVEIQKLL